VLCRVPSVTTQYPSCTLRGSLLLRNRATTTSPPRRRGPDRQETSEYTTVVTPRTQFQPSHRGSFVNAPSSIVGANPSDHQQQSVILRPPSPLPRLPTILTTLEAPPTIRSPSPAPEIFYSRRSDCCPFSSQIAGTSKRSADTRQTRERRSPESKDCCHSKIWPTGPPSSTSVHNRIMVFEMAMAWRLLEAACHHRDCISREPSLPNYRPSMLSQRRVACLQSNWMKRATLREGV
jgi:hypothetical protein